MPQLKKLFVLLIWICACSGQKAEHHEADDNVQNNYCEQFTCFKGAVVRGDTTKRSLAIVFTGGDFGDGGEIIRDTLRNRGVKAGFFFTGDYYRNPQFQAVIKDLKSDGHYLGAHSDRHLLYCDWVKRDSLLIDQSTFLKDLKDNYAEMARFGIEVSNVHLFLPPYEWYNDTISAWTLKAGKQLMNITYGTLSHADYTTPDMPAYRSSETIWNSIVEYEDKAPSGLNGFILLVHIGTDPKRTDKFYLRLGELIDWLREKGYALERIDELLKL